MAPVLSVVAPCFEEEAVLERFHAELTRALRDLDFELVLVDDGSRDRTLEVMNALAARDPRVVPLSLSRNFGQAAALSAGLDAARGDAVVLMDADLQHPPELVLEMVERWRAGADVVSAVRRTTADASFFKRASSAGFYWLLNRVSEVPIEPGAADFCLLSKRVRDVLVAMPERHRFLRGLVAWVGFRRVFLEYDAPPRAAGETKYGARKMLRMALDGIFAFSTAPIRFAVRAGLFVVALGLVYVAYVLWRVATGGTVAGWASLMCVMLVLGGLQIVVAGLLGEYLARTFEQSKGRPIYVLKQGRDERAR